MVSKNQFKTENDRYIKGLKEREREKIIDREKCSKKKKIKKKKISE
jgi:hypothetical protein